MALSYHIKRENFLHYIIQQFIIYETSTTPEDDLIHKLKNYIKRGTNKIYINGDFVIVMDPIIMILRKGYESHFQSLTKEYLKEYLEKDVNIISRAELWKGNILKVFLNRNVILQSTLSSMESLCSSTKLDDFNLELTVPNIDENRCITKYRCHLVALHMKKVLEACGASVHFDSSAEKDINHSDSKKVRARVTERFDTNRESPQNLVLCSPVIQKPGEQKLRSDFNSYIRVLVNELRRASEHKCEIIEVELFEDFMLKQAKGCCSLHLMNVNHLSSLKVDVTENSQNTKESAFVLYNHARLCQLFRSLEMMQEKKVIPPLPPIENVDFSLLKQPEEWELFWVFVHRYQEILEDVGDEIVKKLSERHNSPQSFPTHKICKFVHSLAHCLSVYYNRVHVLPPCREDSNLGVFSHLLPTLWPRVYLLKSVHSVMKACLECLSVEAPSLM